MTMFQVKLNGNMGLLVMALFNMRDILHHAYHNGYVVGAFDLVCLEFLEGNHGRIAMTNP